MMQRDAIYIGGEWVEANGEGTIEVVNPATEQTIGSVPVGSSSDVDAAVAAARRAFPEWSESAIDVR
ncbi:MAG TPA: aldehyde dehydrogenase family protein, partial [Candidatus Poseidoniales archaeon]|nr:aldehyde dehydrogenase family protein [Candidatus Poseidoniales archaeon]